MKQFTPIDKNILMVSFDRKIFEEGSSVRLRMLEYGTLVQELHIIVFTRGKSNFHTQKIGENVWLYPTSSWSRWWYVFDAVKLGKSLSHVASSQNISGFPVELGSTTTIDLVTAHDPFETGFAGWLIAKNIHAPLELQIHTDFLSPSFAWSSFLNFFRVRFALFLLGKTKYIRVVSDRIRRSLYNSKLFGVGTFPYVTVLPVYVDIEYIKQFVPNIDLREKYPQFKNIILMVNRLEKEKGVGFALGFLKGLLRKNAGWGVVVVGEGSLKHSLERRVRAWGMEDQIVFEGWADDTMSYFKTADIFLSTSRYEGYGMALVEALASGCPITTTDVGVVGDLVSKRYTMVCPTNKEECFRIHLGKTMADEDSLEHFKHLADMAQKETHGESREAYLARHHNNWRTIFERERNQV